MKQITTIYKKETRTSMMKTGVFKAITLGLIICFTLSAGCASLPEEETPAQSTSSVSDTTPSVSDGEVDQVNYSTPIPTPTEEEKPEYSIPPDENISGPQYSVIYSKEEYLRYTVIPFDLDLKYPPLIFEYDLEIDTVTDVKAAYSEYGSKSEYSYTLKVPSQNAWYTISVYNNETGELVSSKELNHFGDTSVSGVFKIYGAGDYHIEISGNLVTANTTVMLPPENLN
ncbi:conserved hypothetical protein [Methanolacinia petrolearia DSM 11571]|uniref:Uncharacterized protein n=1 Tax=Methanolacinia petrolearia (strain DSM 11571 / OCM 486 / SEBR 4847) TaxID=679926 RepID=E1RFE4_METP4|nr:hypothetical protein [Methanolacinia petrolearia]ADN36174.1 conserved hypothetical protein [Methanolacinia petrolearia DSM 11571]